MKCNSKLIAAFLAFATVFAIVTMQVSESEARPFGKWWPSIHGSAAPNSG